MNTNNRKGNKSQRQVVVQGGRRGRLITENDLADDLKKKLFPGLENEEFVIERVKGEQTSKAITICVTTRAIGFGTVNIFRELSNYYNNVPLRGDIFQFYKVGLAIVQAKVAIAQRGVVEIMNNEDDYAELRVHEECISLTKDVIALPNQLSLVINAIGKIKTNDRLYVPKIGRTNISSEGQFIPQSEQVTYKNLRQTVESLSDVNTPNEYRYRFYISNPIPGAIWRGVPRDPILTNADDIMPSNYNNESLAVDISEICSKINFLKRKMPRHFTRPISFSPVGDKSMLCCNDQENLRVIDRRDNEDLLDYYQRLELEGNITKYYNLEKLTAVEQKSGCLNLLGEHPNIENLEYPVYVNRNQRICTQDSILNYRAARNMFF